MLLSIILPVYNAERYLAKCLESILVQSYENFEVIVINDGSTDASVTVCKNYAKKDQRIKFISQENQGVAMTRNNGLNIAKGDYIGFVDADDYIENDMFLNLVNPILKQAFDVVISHYKIVNQDNSTISQTKLPINKVLKVPSIKNHILKTYYSGNDPLVPALWNKIYKKEFLETNHLKFHNQKGVRASDFWFNFEVFKKAELVYVIENANYVYNNAISGSIINSFRENQFEVYAQAQQKLLNENSVFKFKINNSDFFTPFFYNTNQFILSAIKAKGFKNAYNIIKPVLKNSLFLTSFNNVPLEKQHLKTIHLLLKSKMILPVYLSYCIWASKIN